MRVLLAILLLLAWLSPASACSAHARTPQQKACYEAAKKLPKEEQRAYMQGCVTGRAPVSR